VATRPPFRHLASLTERDHAHLHGRDRDLAALTEHVLYRRALIYTAPSGVGKTSLLRAGLVPRLETLGARAVYLACRSGSEEALAQAIWPGALGVADAVATWHEQRGRKLVLIVDQLEAAFSEADVPAIVEEALGFDRWPVAAEVSVVLSVREDFLARLMSATRRLPEGVEVARLAPLTRDGARAAILGPLTEQRLTIEPALLEALLTDLVKAAAAVGVQMGWGRGEAVYPPHLQLACSVLYDSLPSGDALISLEHYRRLGGLDAIVGEYFDRVLDTEIDAASAAVARELFPALVTASQTRAFQTEAQLIEAAGAGGRVGEVLEKLRARGLVARVRAGGDEWGWELIHDSLVPRVLAWLDRRDLARRRAVELVRYHLRRSRPEAPSLLGRGELRELDDHGVALAELEADLARRGGDPGRWTPLSLVRRSRQVLRRRALALGGALATTLVAAGTVGYRSLEERSLRDRDLGRFALELSAFDWDPAAQRAIAVTELPALTWTLHEPDAKDPESPGAPVARHLVVRGPSELVGASRRDHVEARAGAAFLLVTGRDGDCAPSVVPLRRLPGYATREGPEERGRRPRADLRRDLTRDGRHRRRSLRPWGPGGSTGAHQGAVSPPRRGGHRRSARVPDRPDRGHQRRLRPLRAALLGPDPHAAVPELARPRRCGEVGPTGLGDQLVHGARLLPLPGERPPDEPAMGEGHARRVEPESGPPAQRPVGSAAVAGTPRTSVIPAPTSQPWVPIPVT
jgi:hypothetical protein